jgi:hypothetical protein
MENKSNNQSIIDPINMMKEYTELYLKYKKECREQQAEYKIVNNLRNSYNSIDHPIYFEIEHKFESLISDLNKPLLENAYYKIGDELTFVKKNNFTIKDTSKPHLLIDKKWKSSIIFLNESRYNNQIDNENSGTINGNVISGVKNYYENVLSKGVVSGVFVSHDGSGEIMYVFNEITPPCKEYQPCIRETDVITVF